MGLELPCDGETYGTAANYNVCKVCVPRSSAGEESRLVTAGGEIVAEVACGGRDREAWWHLGVEEDWTC